MFQTFEFMFVLTRVCSRRKSFIFKPQVSCSEKNIVLKYYVHIEIIIASKSANVISCNYTLLNINKKEKNILYMFVQ